MSSASTTDPLAPTASTAGRAWLSLGPASALLGVDPGTLRRWADEGRVPVYTTPGGHRRFDRRALERLATERRPGMGRRTTRPSARPLASLGATPERLQRVYRRSYSATDAPADAAGRRSTTPIARRTGTTAVGWSRRSSRTWTPIPLTAAARASAEADAEALVDDLARRLAAGHAA